MKFRVIVVTDTQTNKQTNKQTQPQTHPQTGPITIHYAAKLSAQCNNALNIGQVLYYSIIITR